MFERSAQMKHRMRQQPRNNNTVVAPKTRRQALAMLERICPHEFKAGRVRNIVRRTLLKSKTKDFVETLDAVLAAVDQVHDIGEQLTAINPRLEKAQRDGTLVRQHNEAVLHLAHAWGKLIALV